MRLEGLCAPASEGGSEELLFVPGDLRGEGGRGLLCCLLKSAVGESALTLVAVPASARPLQPGAGGGGGARTWHPRAEARVGAGDKGRGAPEGCWARGVEAYLLALG